MNGNVAMQGKLNARVIHAPGPGLRWFVANWLNWSKIKSLIGVFLVAPVARLFGLMTAYGKLEQSPPSRRQSWRLVER